MYVYSQHPKRVRKWKELYFKPTRTSLDGPHRILTHSNSLYYRRMRKKNRNGIFSSSIQLSLLDRAVFPCPFSIHVNFIHFFREENIRGHFFIALRSCIITRRDVKKLYILHVPCEDEQKTEITKAMVFQKGEHWSCPSVFKLEWTKKNFEWIYQWMESMKRFKWIEYVIPTVDCDHGGIIYSPPLRFYTATSVMMMRRIFQLEFHSIQLNTKSASCSSSICFYVSISADTPYKIYHFISSPRFHFFSLL